MNNFWLDESFDEEDNFTKEFMEFLDNADYRDGTEEDSSDEDDAAFLRVIKMLGEEDKPNPDEFFDIKEEDIEFANSIGWYPDASLKAIQILEALCKENIPEDKKAEFYEAIWDVYDTLLTETVLPVTDKMWDETQNLKKIIVDLENQLLQAQRSLRFTEDMLRNNTGE